MEGKCVFFKLVINCPFFRKIEEFPISAALRASVIMSVQLLPFSYLFWSVPKNLRIRSEKYIICPALKLFSFRSIQYFIIFPIICDEHNKILYRLRQPTARDYLSGAPVLIINAVYK